MSDDKHQPGTSALLGDLESIRTLLEESQAAHAVQASKNPPVTPVEKAPSDAVADAGADADADAGADAGADADADTAATGEGAPDDALEPAGDTASKEGAEHIEGSVPADDDVPLLEDVVRGGVAISESFVSGEGDFQDSEETSGLNDEIFKALLSDEWREAARDLLDEARATIENHQTVWTPEHTDTLNSALQVRIDQTLQRWLHDAVHSRIDDLRHALLAAMKHEIRATIDEQFNHLPPNEEPDGE